MHILDPEFNLNMRDGAQDSFFFPRMIYSLRNVNYVFLVFLII